MEPLAWLHKGAKPLTGLLFRWSHQQGGGATTKIWAWVIISSASLFSYLIPGGLALQSPSVSCQARNTGQAGCLSQALFPPLQKLWAQGNPVSVALCRPGIGATGQSETAPYPFNAAFLSFFLQGCVSASVIFHKGILVVNSCYSLFLWRELERGTSYSAILLMSFPSLSAIKCYWRDLHASCTTWFLIFPLKHM